MILRIERWKKKKRIEFHKEVPILQSQHTQKTDTIINVRNYQRMINKSNDVAFCLT